MLQTALSTTEARRGAAVALLIAMLVFTGACSKKKKKVAIPAASRRAVVIPPKIGDTEFGIASWYGHPYHGRRAANGEVYDMEKMTAAHRTLPFETWVEVENLSNRKTTTVRITDRGPFIEGRIVDLSRAAARQLDLIGPGITQVKLTVIAPPAVVPAVDLFAVQVGAFADAERAERVRAEFGQRFGAAQVVRRAGNPVLWRVLVGRETTEPAAEQLAEAIRAGGGQRAFVVRLDNVSGENSGGAPAPTQ